MVQNIHSALRRSRFGMVAAAKLSLGNLRLTPNAFLMRMLVNDRQKIFYRHSKYQHPQSFSPLILCLFGANFSLVVTNFLLLVKLVCVLLCHELLPCQSRGVFLNSLKFWCQLDKWKIEKSATDQNLVENAPQVRLEASLKFHFSIWHRIHIFSRAHFHGCHLKEINFCSSHASFHFSYQILLGCFS